MMTALTIHKGVLREFPISGDQKLGERMFDYHPASPPHIVYGYIINRRPAFAAKFYGWALER